MNLAFAGCSNLTGNASRHPRPLRCDGYELHVHFLAFNQDIDNWNTANVTNMNGMFRDAYHFNQDISHWNTANVTNMSHMFCNASPSTGYQRLEYRQCYQHVITCSGTPIAFNQDISGWNTANVDRYERHVLRRQRLQREHRQLGYWQGDQHVYMFRGFTGATAFNQAIGNWNTASVTEMGSMF